jgi:hypothetical protein
MKVGGRVITEKEVTEIWRGVAGGASLLTV